MTESAKPISSIETIEMPLDEAIKLIGAQLPETLPELTREYGGQIWASIENTEYAQKKTMLGHA